MVIHRIKKKLPALHYYKDANCLCHSLWQCDFTCCSNAFSSVLILMSFCSAFFYQALLLSGAAMFYPFVGLFFSSACCFHDLFLGHALAELFFLLLGFLSSQNAMHKAPFHIVHFYAMSFWGFGLQTSNYCQWICSF